LACWLKENKTTYWAEGLKFIQFSKNISYHSGIKRSPYEAMYGCAAKLGISSSKVPSTVLNNIQSEEDLLNVLENRDTLERDEDGESQVSNRSSNQSEREENNEEEIQSIEVSLICIICEGEVSPSSLCITCSQPVHYSVSCSFQQASTSDSSPQYMCQLCHQTESIASNRIGAHEGLVSQASKMKKNSDASLPPCEIGDTVLVPVPEVDRAKTDFRKIKAVILSVDNNFYKLGTEAGILHSVYARSQFDVCSEKFISINDVPENQIALRSAATALSIGSGQGFVRCNCNGKCTNNRCKCRKANTLCNSKCHSSLPCENK